MIGREIRNRSIPPVWRVIPVGGIWMGGSMDSLQGLVEYTCEIRCAPGIDSKAVIRLRERPERPDRRSPFRGFGQRFIKKIIKHGQYLLNKLKEPALMRLQRELVINDMMEENHKRLVVLQTTLLYIMSGENYD